MSKKQLQISKFSGKNASAREKVFSILSSIAQKKALTELSKPDNEEKQALPIRGQKKALPELSRLTNKEKKVKASSGQKMTVTDLSRPTNNEEKVQATTGQFGFIPNFENEAVAQMLRIPANSQSQIKITLGILEKIIMSSQNLKKSDLVGIIDLNSHQQSSRRNFQPEIMGSEGKSQTKLEAIRNPASKIVNSGNTDIPNTSEGEALLRKNNIQQVFGGETVEITSDQYKTQFEGHEKEDIHIALLSQLPDDVLTRLSTEVPSLASQIKLARAKQQV